MRQALTISSPVPSSTGLLSNSREVTISGGTFTEIRGDQYQYVRQTYPICMMFTTSFVDLPKRWNRLYSNVARWYDRENGWSWFLRCILTDFVPVSRLTCSSTVSLNMAIFEPLARQMSMNRTHSRNTLLLSTIRSWLLELTEGNLLYKWVLSHAFMPVWTSSFDSLLRMMLRWFWNTIFGKSCCYCQSRSCLLTDSCRHQHLAQLFGVCLSSKVPTLIFHGGAIFLNVRWLVSDVYLENVNVFHFFGILLGENTGFDCLRWYVTVTSQPFATL